MKRGCAARNVLKPPPGLIAATDVRTPTTGAFGSREGRPAKPHEYSSETLFRSNSSPGDLLRVTVFINALPGQLRQLYEQPWLSLEAAAEEQ